MNQENLNNEVNNVVAPDTIQEFKNNTSKKNKKKLIIIISCVCLLLVAVAVYFFVFNKNKDEDVKEDSKQTENRKEKMSNDALSLLDAAEKYYIDNKLIYSASIMISDLKDYTDVSNKYRGCINITVDTYGTVSNKNIFLTDEEYYINGYSYDNIKKDKEYFVSSFKDDESKKESFDSGYQLCEYRSSNQLSNKIPLNNDSTNDSSKSSESLIKEILEALNSSDVKVQKIVCSNCKQLDETTIGSLSCTEPVSLETSSIEILKNKISSLLSKKGSVFSYGMLCNRYKITIDYNNNHYYFAMTDSGSIVIGKDNKNGNEELYDISPEYSETFINEYSQFFESL